MSTIAIDIANANGRAYPGKSNVWISEVIAKLLKVRFTRAADSAVALECNNWLRWTHN
jgi:hypothetical protein